MYTSCGKWAVFEMQTCFFLVWFVLDFLSLKLAENGVLHQVMEKE